MGVRRLDLGRDRHRRDTETRSQYSQEHSHRGADHYRAVRVHEFDVHVGFDDRGDGERAGGGGLLGGTSSAVLDGLSDTARCGFVDLWLRPQRAIQRGSAVLRSGPGGPRAACLQLRSHQEDDAGRGGDLPGPALAHVPDTGRHNRSDRVRQFSHVGVLRIRDGVAHNHATDEVGRAPTVPRADRDTMAGVGRFHFSLGASDNLRTVDQVSIRARVYSNRRTRVSRVRVQESDEHFVR